MLPLHLNNTLSEKETSVAKALNRASELISPTKPILTVYKNQNYNDEPPFFQYTAVINSKHSDNLVGGSAIDKKRALLKTLGEGIERYCLEIQNKQQLIRASYSELTLEALNPSTIVAFSKNQLKRKKIREFRFDGKTKFLWVQGYSLSQDRPIFVPAQLVYVPYHLGNEPIIRFPITTGAAAGSSLASAVYRGICEVIERDAFLITYLNKLPRKRIVIEKTRNKTLQKLNALFKRYKLELHLVDLTTDVLVPTVAAIILDKTTVGPAVSVGLKTSLDLIEAIIGAIEEAQHTRPWIRDEMTKNPNIKKIKKRAQKITDIIERGLFWSTKDMIQHISFLLQGEVINLEKLLQTAKNSKKSPLDNLLTILEKFQFDIIFVEVTTPNVAKVSFHVVKVIIPQLQPLYLDEPFKYLGGERLYQLPVILDYYDKPKSENQLNKIPHPFL